MKFLRCILAAVIVLASVASEDAARAQAVPGLMSTGADAVLTRLFGENKAFTADAVLKVYDPDEQEILGTTMGFAVRDEKLRMDVDISRLKSRELPAGIAGSLRQIGMEKVVSLVLPEKRASYLIYPGLQAVLKVPMKAADLKAGASDFRLERVAIGKETLDGHACVKHRVKITDTSGVLQEATTWNATGLNDFPVQIQIADGGNSMILRFRNVKLLAPGADLFELPAGYTQYDSQEALMQAVMMKALEGLGASGES